MGCNSTRIVRDITFISRAFAAIGLMRRVTAATPPDLVCTYILQSRQPGLMCYVFDIADDKNNWEVISTINRASASDRSITFPTGITKMAKNYLVRMFWKNIRSLNRLVHHVGCGYDPDYAGVKIYPKEVCDVLGHIRVHSNSILWDTRNAIQDLHAVATPTMLDAPAWMTNNYAAKVNKSMFSTLSDIQTRNLDALKCVLENYCWNTGNQHIIPNDAEKSLLLDLIECFMMLEVGDYRRMYRIRQAYECARVGAVFGKASRIKKLSSTDLFGNNSEYVYEACANRFIEELKYSSPEAALCMQVLKNPGIIYNVPKFSKESITSPINEVVAYLNAELCVENEKCEHVNRLIEEFKQGNYHRGYGFCHPEAECCEAPVPMDSPAY